MIQAGGFWGGRVEGGGGGGLSGPAPAAAHQGVGPGTVGQSGSHAG